MAIKCQVGLTLSAISLPSSLDIIFRVLDWGIWTRLGHPDIPVFRELLCVTTMVFLIAWKPQEVKALIKCLAFPVFMFEELGSYDVMFSRRAEWPSVTSVTYPLRAGLEFKRKWPEPDLCIGKR